MFQFILIIALFPYSHPESCICSADKTSSCLYTIVNNVVQIQGCNCPSGYTAYLETATTGTDDPEVRCLDDSLTTTVVSEKDMERLVQAQLLRCHISSMNETWENVTKYLLVTAAAWIVFWCLASIVTNIRHKNYGHHRYIHLFEEVIIVLLVAVIGGVNRFFPLKETICRIISIASHYLMVSAATAFLMEANFAHSMVHGKANKNGVPPVILNYIVPLVLPALPAGLTYYFEKEYYGASLVHCFASLTRDMMWGFVIPSWVLLSAAVVKAQLSCLSCDLTQMNQDKLQCFWAKRAAKVLVIVSGGLYSLWLLTMHAVEQYKIYLFILDFVLCLLYGPILFVCHTYCHENTCTKWGGKATCLGSLYYKCIDQKSPVIYEEKIVYVPNNQNDKDIRKPYEIPKPADTVYMNPATAKPTELGGDHVPAQRFYSWLTEPSSNSNILFNRNK
ncbi:unnamed protein product [Auanema sp. JU1783]|nr:unnamed protein product [Auanema sp. JU1783]